MTLIRPQNLKALIQTHYEALKEKTTISEECPYSLETILTAPPLKLKEIAHWFDGLTNTQKERYTNIAQAYTNFETKKQEYNAYDLAKNLNINVCPYCNINPTYTIILENGEEIIRPEFDHFYCQSDYPILALSFFNLIPSCHTCNANLKRNKTLTLHPYKDDFDLLAHFKLNIHEVSFYHSTKGFEITLQTDDEDAKKWIKLFKLQDRYNKHKDTVLELIQKQHFYNESYIDELYKGYEGTFFKKREDVIRHISCGYVKRDEIHKRPLSKLIKDISEELGLL